MEKLNNITVHNLARAEYKPYIKLHVRDKYIAIDVAAKLIGNKTLVEHAIVLALNNNGTPIACSVLGYGDETGVKFPVKQIAKFAIDVMAKNIILIHNHPSQLDLYFSSLDKHAMLYINDILSLFDIELRDFIIVSADLKEKLSYQAKYGIPQPKQYRELFD